MFGRVNFSKYRRKKMRENEDGKMTVELGYFLLEPIKKFFFFRNREKTLSEKSDD